MLAILASKHSTFCSQNTFRCFVWIPEQTAITVRYNINGSVFITETESVYCAVRTGSLNKLYNVSSLRDKSEYLYGK